MTSSSEYLTKAQIIKIAPLFIPYFVFQFTPFLYFGTLLLVMNEIYSNNELISFKALGLSYKKLLKVFFIITLIVELFVFLIINLYPITTKSFYKQKVSFATDNIFKNLKKDSFSKIGKYTIYFRTINKNNELERVTIFKLDDKKKNIIYAETAFFILDNEDKVKLVLKDATINDISYNQKDTNIYTISLDRVDVDLDDVINGNNKNLTMSKKQKIRSYSLAEMINIYIKNHPKNHIFIDEFHSRFVYSFLVIITLTIIFSLLLLRNTNRIEYKKLLYSVIILGIYFSLNRSFTFDGFVKAEKIYIFYLQFIIVSGTCLFYMFHSITHKSKKKILKK